MSIYFLRNKLLSEAGFLRYEREGKKAILAALNSTTSFQRKGFIIWRIVGGCKKWFENRTERLLVRIFFGIIKEPKLVSVRHLTAGFSVLPMSTRKETRQSALRRLKPQPGKSPVSCFRTSESGNCMKNVCWKTICKNLFGIPPTQNNTRKLRIGL